MPAAELAQLETALAAATTVENIAAAITSVGRHLVGCDGISFVLNEQGRCHYLDTDGIQPLWKGQFFPADSCVSGWVMRHRQTVVIPNVFMDSRVPHDVYRRTFVKSMQMVPVGENGEAAIGAYWAEYHDPTDGESMMLYGIARLAAAALRRLAAAKG